MNEEIQARFDRIETALNTLVDSITSYRPSQSAAVSLVAADDELTQGLERLTQHQFNQNTIVSLRATSDALDGQIKNTLTLLADTRKELLTATPIGSASTNGKPLRPLEYAELLNYAQRIARFTVPPADQRIPKQAVVAGDVADVTRGSVATPAIKIQIQSPDPRLEQHTNQQQTTTPVQTPVPTSPKPQAAGSHYQAADGNRAVDALPEEIRQWLDPASSKAQFTPWPGEDVIRRGALARIQGMLENGQDPAATGSNGAADAVVPDEQQNTHEKVAADRNRDGRPAAVSQGVGRPRQESHDDGIMSFDLYEPDDE